MILFEGQVKYRFIRVLFENGYFSVNIPVNDSGEPIYYEPVPYPGIGVRWIKYNLPSVISIEDESTWKPYFEQAGRCFTWGRLIPYSRPVKPAFRCIQAGTSGSEAPVFPRFLVDEQRANPSFFEAILKGYGYNIVNTGGDQYGKANPTDLEDFWNPDWTAFSQGIVNDGTCIWEVINPGDVGIYISKNLSKKRYNRSEGSQIVINGEQKYPPGDFIYNATTETYKVLSAPDPKSPVVAINPMSARETAQDLLEKSVEAIQASPDKPIQVSVDLQFQDYWIYTPIQMVDVTTNQILVLLLQAIVGEFYIQCDGDMPKIVMKDALLPTEYKNIQADYVIPRQLTRKVEVERQSITDCNIINVVKSPVVEKFSRVIQRETV